MQQVTYDAAGRPSCVAVRMNPAEFSGLPSSACTLGTTGGFGPDRIVQTTYDDVGRPLTTTSALGTADALTESVAYTDNGQVESLTDGQGNVSIKEYDGFDRLANLRYPNATGGGTSTTDYEQYAFDDYGRLSTSRSRAGQTTSYTWDLLGRLRIIDAPSGTDDIEYRYDLLGRKTSVSTDVEILPIVCSATTTCLVWDALSRQTSQTDGFGVMAYEYDAADRMTRIIWPDSFYAAYDYDLTGAVTAIRENGATSGAGVLAQYAYSNLGQLTEITRAGGSGAATIYGYDAFARLVSLAHDASGGGDDVTLGFSYNPADQTTGRTVNDTDYVWAPATGATTYQLNGLNEVTQIDSASVTYDSNRNATAVPGATYGYDAASRLTSANTGSAATFAFVQLSRLYQSSMGGVTTRYHYAGQQLATEYNASGVVTRRYVPGLGLDGVITAYTGSGTSTRDWLLADERGSVIALTGSTGAVTNINRYDEYGVPASGNTGRFQYTGQPWLPEAGAYHYRARTYLPQVGRFLQTDPIGYAAGANLYAYVSADPVNLIDPSGLDEEISVAECYRRGGFPSGRIDGKSGLEICDFSLTFFRWAGVGSFDLGLGFLAAFDLSGGAENATRQCRRNTAGDILGKLNGAGNTALGALWAGFSYAGGLGAGTDPYFQFGNNSIQMINSPFQYDNRPVSLGNVQVYGTDPNLGPSGYTISYTGSIVNNGRHEEGHSYQSQFLGSLYLPAEAIGALAGDKNFMEVGADKYARGESCSGF